MDYYHAVYLAVIVVLVIIIMIMKKKTKIEIKPPIATDERKIPLRPDVSPAILLRERSMKEYKSDVDVFVANAGLAFEGNTKLVSCMCSAIAGGKRLRPLILLEICRANCLNNGNVVDASEAALSVEYLHAASLVIDDMPDFDDDLLRRGEESMHAKYGGAVAQMAALSLVASSFENMCRQVDNIKLKCARIQNPDEIGVEMCRIITKMIGHAGAASGQYMDVTVGETENLGDTMIYLKTATFFTIATVCGWLVSGGQFAAIDDMKDLGRHYGIAFQVADDIADMESDAAKKRPSWNYANTYGIEAARKCISGHLEGAKVILSRYNILTPIWEGELFPLLQN